MVVQLDKSHFRKYLECHREFWLAFHEPHLVQKPSTPDIAFRISQGYEVEQIAKEMFSARGDFNYQFQKTIETERFKVRFDIFAETPVGNHLYEVKSSLKTQDNKDNKKARQMNLWDVAFQYHAAKEAEVKLSRVSLITLNGDYRLGNTLDPESFLDCEDVTETVLQMQNELQTHIENAFWLMENEPAEDFSALCSLKLRCPFFKWKFPDLPSKTIFDIPRISPKMICELRNRDVLALADVPVDFKLTEIQRSFVNFQNNGEIEISRAEIDVELSRLSYPIYFLDYETVNPCVPKFRGMSPSQHIVFQYSLHILESSEAKLIHREFLSDGTGEPPRELAQCLSEAIGKEGSVIVWYKHFEMGRNRELAALYPEYADFFENVNDRIFDLYEIFSRNLYRNPAITSNSIKSVLPVLVPELSYKDLEIGNGALALARWYDEVYHDQNNRKEITMTQLREYCKLDTLAMVRIFHRIRKDSSPGKVAEN